MTSQVPSPQSPVLGPALGIGSAPPRRGFLLGATAVGAGAAAWAALSTAPDTATQAKLPAAPEGGGGYTLTQHVKRYYQTAMI